MIHAPMRPWPQFFSTMTGPLVNFLIAGVAAPIFLLLSDSGEALLTATTAQSTLGLSFLHSLVTVNVIMLIFNVIPAIPLDGGRMFQAALWPKLGFRRAMTWAVYTSFVCAALMLGYAVYAQSVILCLIAVFVGQGAALERQRLRYGAYDDLLATASDVPVELVVRDPEPTFAEREEERAEDDRRRKRELRERLDQVLAVVSEVGLDGLSNDDRVFLDQASQELRKEQSGKP